MFKKKQLPQQEKPKIFKSPYQHYSSPYYEKIQIKEFQNQSPIKQQLDQHVEQNFDNRRLRRAMYEFQGQFSNRNQSDEEQDKPQTTLQRRPIVKMNVFRQSAREQQRQFHQQNHEYLRMFNVMARSATNPDKFRIKEYKQGNGNKNQGQNKTKLKENFSTVQLQLNTEVTSSLINYKFPVRQIYNTVPYKRQSIQIECREFLDPKFEFFVFEKCSDKAEIVRQELQNVLQEGLSSQFKGNVIRAMGNLDFFQFLDLSNYRQHFNDKGNKIIYPKQILQIAIENENFELNSDEEEFYTRGTINIDQPDTNQRLVGCQDEDLAETDPSIYFQRVEEYTLYKKHREIEFKKLKIYDKDITINTDIRNIISSEKIYLIELIKEIELYIQMSTYPIEIKIMKEIYKQLRRKAEEFLKVICNYTESKILKHYNIDNYHQKISMFIEKSIKYEKEIQVLPPEVLKEFPILKIWYQIPRMLFGYPREKVHGKYYDLVRTILIYEQKIKDYELEKQLSIKRPGVKYPQ